MSTQVTIIGGSSYQWGPELMADLFGTPPWSACISCSRTSTRPPLPKMEALAHKLTEALGAKATAAVTTDQKSALEEPTSSSTAKVSGAVTSPDCPARMRGSCAGTRRPKG